jgi:hypothetical protein
MSFVLTPEHIVGVLALIGVIVLALSKLGLLSFGKKNGAKAVNDFKSEWSNQCQYRHEKVNEILKFLSEATVVQKEVAVHHEKNFEKLDTKLSSIETKINAVCVELGEIRGKISD